MSPVWRYRSSPGVCHALRMTKKEIIEQAATRLRIIARINGTPVTRDQAWDCIAWVRPDKAVSATDVLRVARRELRANGEGHLA